MIDRCEGHGGAAETQIGYIPRPEDFDLEGLDITRETMRELFAIKPDEWKNEIAGQQEFFDRIERFMPPELSAQREKIAARFNG
jgi:phosphoenolpyruvate carboxykinase (GTP)